MDSDSGRIRETAAAEGAAGQTDITEKFADAKFRAEVYKLIGKTAPAPILDSDVSGITCVNVSGSDYEWGGIMESLSGIVSGSDYERGGVMKSLS
ncbi:hypothetical protein, partial [Treponema sp. R8-4-B8]